MTSNPREVLRFLRYHVDAGRVRAQSFPDLEAVAVCCAVAIGPAVAHPVTPVHTATASATSDTAPPGLSCTATPTGANQSASCVPSLLPHLLSPPVGWAGYTGLGATRCGPGLLHRAARDPRSRHHRRRPCNPVAASDRQPLQAALPRPLRKCRPFRRARTGRDAPRA